MTANALENLETALLSVFSNEEAGCLARLLHSFNSGESIYYENIDLSHAVKDDCILTAFEERLIIPQLSSQGSAWEDRMLQLQPGALYIMPWVTRRLVDGAEANAVFDPNGAIRQVMAEKDEGLARAMIDFFNKLKPHAVSYKVEGGLMNTLNRGYDPPLDLHEVLDHFVLAGMMSPCTRGPITKGLVWYEINPSLYWGD